MGGVPGVWQWQLEMPGGGGEVVPASDNGVKMFQMAEFDVFTARIKKKGQRISASFAIVMRSWGWAICK